jgi:hypothetical protein
LSIAEIIIEVRKQRVKFKHIFLNKDMYDALTVNGHKVRTSLERQFDCCIFKSVTKVTTIEDTLTEVTTSTIGEKLHVNLEKVLNATNAFNFDEAYKLFNSSNMTEVKPSASYEDILNAL